MYSEDDFRAIDRSIARCRIALIPVLAAFAAFAALGYVKRVKWLALGGLALLAAAACFGVAFFLWPCLRYRGFLRDMREGLSREMVGSVVSVADAPEPQDGALVLPVHILLTREQDERIVYLNASKRDKMPPVGTEARFSLYGRHIREIFPA
ncbi:MAG: hypothetical protein IJH86_02815 [Clostridia bacterium]|nr:hypothetical protein [Clostridia bacterium]